MWYSDAISVWIMIVTILILSVILALQTLIVTRSAEKGRWKQTIFTTQKAFIFIGILLLVVGIVAKVVGQSFSVWSSLCMPGFFYIIVMLLQLLVTKKLYASYQKKKEQAEETAPVEQIKEENKAIEQKSSDRYKGIYNNLSDK